MPSHKKRKPLMVQDTDIRRAATAISACQLPQSSSRCRPADPPSLRKMEEKCSLPSYLIGPCRSPDFGKYFPMPSSKHSQDKKNHPVIAQMVAQAEATTSSSRSYSQRAANHVLPHIRISNSNKDQQTTWGSHGCHSPIPRPKLPRSTSEGWPVHL